MVNAIVATGRENFSLTSPPWRRVRDILAIAFGKKIKIAPSTQHIEHKWVKIYGDPAHSVAVQGTVGGLANGILTKV